MYHVYNRDARVIYVGDITSVNADMKFGLARSFMGEWKWHSPDYFNAVDPNTGIMCAYQNDKGNKGYWLGEYDLGEKTIYPEIERLIFALGQPQQYVRKPNTGTVATAPTTSADYQALLAYNAQCGEYNPPTSFIYPSED